MWALRRASTTSLRAQGLNLAAVRTACAGLGPLNNQKEDKSSSSIEPTFRTCLTSKTCHCTLQVPHQLCVGHRSLSSQAGAKSGGEEENNLEDGFSELETTEASETTGDADAKDDTTSTSESESSDDEENLEDALETELAVDTEVEAGEKASKKRKHFSAFGKVIIEAPASSVADALDKYVADGKDLSRAEIYDAMLRLRRLKNFGKALQLSEWLETNNRIDFVERDYASMLDLIAKVHGLQTAENYIDKVPESYRKEVLYRTLLANCVSATNAKKAEEVFNKMKDLGFQMTSFGCNQLLLLYKRTDRKKIADVLLMMEKEDIKPTLFTYQLLIDTKGQANDMAGMGQIVETMKAEGIELNTRIKATLARHYAAAGLKEKAEEVLQEMEGSDLKVNRWICTVLLPIYADLGKAADVERVWKVCESNPRERDYLAAIIAWGKLKKVEKAEALFNEMAKKKLGTKQFSIMLKVYADNKMLNKGKELLKRMGDSGCPIGPYTWDALVKLYVDAGEVEKADSILHKAMKQNTRKPLFNTFMTILDQYARRGDIHNTEKIFQRMRQAGYVARVRPFHALLQAYINANAPAYGIRERMKADNVFPNKGLAMQLSQVDAFKKTAVSELLD